MKPIVLGVVLVALVASCSEKKQSRHRDDDEDTGGCKLAPDAKPADLAVGKAAGMVAPLQGIKLGMSPAEAKAACPNLFKGENATRTGTFSAGEIIGTSGTDYLHGRLQFTADKLTSVAVQAPAAIFDALTAAWGAPQKSAGDKGQALAWFDEATHTRAILGPEERGARELKISHYQPLKNFTELDTQTIAFKPTAVLGKTPAELMKAFPLYAGKNTTSESNRKATDKMMEGMKKDLEAKGIKINEHRDDIEVRLPATPYADDTTTHVILYLDDDGTVRSYGVWFRTEASMSGASWPQQRDEIIKLMDQSWGPHKLVKETLGERHTWYSSATGIRASATVDPAKPGELDLVYVRYTPLANLFGAPGSVWGFEKDKPLIGQPLAEVATAYGTAYKADASGDNATIKLPPTDYDGDTAVTTILMFVERGKVREWRFNIPYENYEPAKAEYETLLDAKLGKGKPGGRGHVVYGKSPKVDAEFSEITHNLNVEVSK